MGSVLIELIFTHLSSNWASLVPSDIGGVIPVSVAGNPIFKSTQINMGLSMYAELEGKIITYFHVWVDEFRASIFVGIGK